MNIKKRGGALRGLRINREILILRKPPTYSYIHWKWYDSIHYVRNDHYKVLIKSTDVIIYDTS